MNDSEPSSERQDETRKGDGLARRMATEPAPFAPTSDDGPSGEPDEHRAPQRPRGMAVSHVHEEFRMSVGVLTDPKSLAEYEQVAPGYASKILDKFFEQVALEQVHRHSLEREALATDREHEAKTIQQGDRGQFFAFLIAVIGLFLVGWLAHTEQPWLAGIIGTLDLLGLVSVFIYGRKKQAEEVIAEAKPLPSKGSASDANERSRADDDDTSKRLPKLLGQIDESNKN
ncbi:DUF2335 domain-containing protein [Sorangium sp. So ce1000]|uniref:DUF2335 domain-containing protein n=1 Tax=Sorangium sp. So ce1000 TaxID=3133325 RepID=UPI003F6378C9